MTIIAQSLLIELQCWTLVMNSSFLFKCYILNTKSTLLKSQKLERNLSILLLS